MNRVIWMTIHHLTVPTNLLGCGIQTTSLMEILPPREGVETNVIVDLIQVITAVGADPTTATADIGNGSHGSPSNLSSSDEGRS